MRSTCTHRCHESIISASIHNLYTTYNTQYKYTISIYAQALNDIEKKHINRLHKKILHFT